jgi:hypothetical protein
VSWKKVVGIEEVEKGGVAGARLGRAHDGAFGGGVRVSHMCVAVETPSL